MIGKTVSHYKILEKLGEGGMGVVYKAHDTELDRTVALKFLPHGLTADESEQARFMQEAKAASALNHPNICAIHTLGEHEGERFIDMELVVGKTLREIVPIKKTEDAITYAIQIAEALQEAHTHGIVHRDIKADNIMVNTKNQIKVMDFGLAKLRGTLKLTRTSSTIGTLAYMAPEQIEGGEVDARSDIFSFGIVLFEMLTGQMPFRGEHEAAMMYSILNEEPQSLSNYRKDCSPELDRIIRRALEKDPEDRYQHADDLVSELRRIKKHTSRVVGPASEPGVPRSAKEHRQPSAQAPAVQPVVPWWRSRAFLIPAAGIVLIGLVVAYLLLQRPATESIRSMAVLPFTNTSGNGATEYLSDGFTEGLINSLSKLPGVKLMSSRSVFRYKGKDVDPQKAAQELHVGAVLTGRILQQGGNLSISAELINAQDNTHIWGNQYNRKEGDLIEVQAAISREISEQLKVTMTGDEKQRFAALPTENVEAYQSFLKGLFSLNKRSQEGFEQASRYFHSAIGLDPTFALAYAGLAQTYILKGVYYVIPTAEATDSARIAAEKALEYDQSLGEARAMLASVAESRWDWTTAEREYRRSIELSPNFATAHQWYGEFLSFMGRSEEGLEYLRKAQELDPLSPIIYIAQGNVLIELRRYDEAIHQAEKALEFDPRFARAFNVITLAQLFKGNHDLALRAAEEAVVASDSSVEYLAWLGYVQGMTGHRADAARMLQAIERISRKQFVSPGIFVLLNAGLGDRNEAFRWLSRAVELRDPAVEGMKVDPSFDPLRNDPRFAELMKKVALPQ